MSFAPPVRPTSTVRFVHQLATACAAKDLADARYFEPLSVDAWLARARVSYTARHFTASFAAPSRVAARPICVTRRLERGCLPLLCAATDTLGDGDLPVGRVAERRSSSPLASTAPMASRRPSTRAKVSAGGSPRPDSRHASGASMGALRHRTFREDSEPART